MKAFTLWKIRHCDEKREVRYLFLHVMVAFLFVYHQPLATQAKNNSANKNEQKAEYGRALVVIFAEGN